MSITAVALALSIGLAAQGFSGYTLHPTTVGAHANHDQARVRPAKLTAQVRYRVVELPTLGGPTNYPSVNRPENQIMANSGAIAIGADTPQMDPYAATPDLCFNPDCFQSRAALWQNGVLTDLKALSGVGNSSASGAINARGWVAGQSENGEIDSATGLPAVHATLWGPNGIVDLGTFGGSWSLSLNLNDLGQVVGFASNSTDDSFAAWFFPSSTQIRAFLWQNGDLRDLGDLGGPDALAFSINESGQVAGVSLTNATPNAATGIPTVHPFLWDHGQMTDLGTLGGTLSGAGPDGWVEIVNNRGQVVGESTLAGDVDAAGNLMIHPFLWDRSTGLKDLGTLGGQNAVAQWLTDTGDVVGYADTDLRDLSGSPIHHAFLWRNGVMTDLGTLGSNSAAMKMNSGGQIVGRSFIPSLHTQHAFLWEDDGPMKDLNDLIPPGTNLMLQEAENINDVGEILVWADPPGCPDDHGCGRLVLLVPCGDSSGCADAAVTAHSASAAMSTRTSSPTLPVTRVSAPTWRAVLTAKYKLRRSAD